MRADLLALADRVESGEGPDREIDKEAVALLGTKNDFGVPFCAGYIGIASFTSSIDAVIRLIREVLPGALWLVATRRDHACAAVTIGLDLTTETKAKDPARALMAATLRAYAAREVGDA